MENLLLALFVLAMILVFKHGTKGFLSSSAILFGIIAGYIAAVVMGFVLPTTGVTADGVEYTKAWVLNWNKVAEASWFEIPKLMPVKPVFDLRAILPVMVMFIVTAVETVGDISGVMEGGMNREPSDKELSGGVICDGLGSTFAACFGVLPNTSFSQNVGLVAMTKVVNRGALATGAVFLGQGWQFSAPAVSGTGTLFLYRSPRRAVGCRHPGSPAEAGSDAVIIPPCRLSAAAG